MSYNRLLLDSVQLAIAKGLDPQMESQLMRCRPTPKELYQFVKTLVNLPFSQSSTAREAHQWLIKYRAKILEVKSVGTYRIPVTRRNSYFQDIADQWSKTTFVDPNEKNPWLNCI